MKRNISQENTLSVYSVVRKAHNLFMEAPYIARIDTPLHYASALDLMDYLLNNAEDHQLLIEILTAAIKQWEQTASEFADFNQQIAEMDGVDILKCLMEQNHLTINDFPEIGSPQLVTAILQRQNQPLTPHQIILLCERFAISPTIFST